MGSLLTQIAAVFSSPLGLAVLALAVLAVAGILLWAFWGQNDIPTTTKVENEPVKTVPPPVLAPTMFTGGSHAVVQKEYTLRNIFLGVLGVGAVAVAISAITNRAPMTSDVDHGIFAENAHGQPGEYAQEQGPEGVIQQVSYEAAIPMATTSAASAMVDPLCVDEFTDMDGLMGYRVCTGDQAVMFDRIDFTRHGAVLINASWNAYSGYTLSADNQPAPFAFDSHVSMRGAPEADINDYDAFVAIGLSEGMIGMGSDPARLSAERAYALGRYTLASLRGETDADCRSDATVMAISLGFSEGYSVTDGSMKPVLLGVRFDRRYSAADRDLEAAVAQFLRSRGTQITGYNLAGFNQRDVLFTEQACQR